MNEFNIHIHIQYMNIIELNLIHIQYTHDIIQTFFNCVKTTYARHQMVTD